MSRKARGHDKPGFKCHKGFQQTPEHLQNRKQVTESIQEGKERKRREALVARTSR